MTNEVPVIEKKKTVNKNIKEPGKYKVVIFNDNVTTVEFVVAVLVNIFNMSHEDAIDVTRAVHNEGSGIAGIYTFEIAEQKSKEATVLARQNSYPLVIKVEAE